MKSEGQGGGAGTGSRRETAGFAPNHPPRRTRVGKTPKSLKVAITPSCALPVTRQPKWPPLVSAACLEKLTARAEGGQATVGRSPLSGLGLGVLALGPLVTDGSPVHKPLGWESYAKLPTIGLDWSPGEGAVQWAIDRVLRPAVAKTTGVLWSPSPGASRLPLISGSAPQSCPLMW
ncbi:unnamed protein product [Lota lota]